MLTQAVEVYGGDQMDVTSLFSGIMIGAGLGMAFFLAIVYTHHREVLRNKEESDTLEMRLAEGSADNSKEHLRETNKARR
jgi:hypothetical protein